MIILYADVITRGNFSSTDKPEFAFRLCSLKKIQKLLRYRKCYASTSVNDLSCSNVV